MNTLIAARLAIGLTALILVAAMPVQAVASEQAGESAEPPPAASTEPPPETLATQPVLLDGPDSFRDELRADGIIIDLWWTQFAQAAIAGDGSDALEYGGKVDAKLTVIGDRVGLWDGLVINVHQEFVYGDDVNNQGDGTFLPVNTALGFPRLGGGDWETSFVIAQKVSEDLTISAGKLNMLDAAAKTPLVGGGGLETFQSIGLAAPVSGVTPPYIWGATASLQTEPASFTLLVYDPRSAQDGDVFDNMFGDGVTFSLSATVPMKLGGKPGFTRFAGSTVRKMGSICAIFRSWSCHPNSRARSAANRSISMRHTPSSSIFS